ncbi:GNAT family N-acetyltransferase [Streptomyces sp. ok210]|uniref:GNAT family N-acetyltransferase n=1 Tax=Streptomyces sp. ok210 TaxID=1761905 RepID=UPI0021091BAD|nr:GNAT family N-acetyltransferase [Streptomyces sp. ok210]
MTYIAGSIQLCSTPLKSPHSPQPHIWQNLQYESKDFTKGVATMQANDPLGPIVSAYAATFEKMAAATGHTRKGTHDALLAVSGSPIAALNAVISTSEEPDPEEIAILAASVSEGAFPWSIHVRGVPGPRIAEIAAQHGLTQFVSKPLMIRRSEQGTLDGLANASLHVRAVSAHELETYSQTLAAGFEGPQEAFQIFADPALGKIDGVTHYVAELDGEPVGTGMTAVHNELTGIFNITTLPKHRRRGYGRVITMEMVRLGRAAGAPTAFLYASKMGEPMYESIGFRTEERMTVITAEL